MSADPHTDWPALTAATLLAQLVTTRETDQSARMARVAEAREARDEGMQAASDHADARLVVTVDKVIADAIASGEPFSSNTIRDRMPTVRPGLIGARIKAASMRSEPRLVRVGEEPSTLRSTHAKPVAIWRKAS